MTVYIAVECLANIARVATAASVAKAYALRSTCEDNPAKDDAEKRVLTPDLAYSPSSMFARVC